MILGQKSAWSESTVLLLFLTQFSSVQSLSCVRLFVTPWISAHQASLFIINSQSLLKSKSMNISLNHCRPLLLLSSIFPSIRVFSNESALRIKWPKYWSFSFSISPSNEHPGLISFRLDWLDLLAVQGTLKSLLQHHSSKASILQCSKLESFLPGWMNSLSTRFSIEEALKLCWNLFFPPPVIPSHRTIAAAVIVFNPRRR